MSNMSTENCLILLADSNFNVFSEGNVTTPLKNELVNKALPKGSKWKWFAGSRSIALFPVESLPGFYGLSYSVVLENVDRPLVSFILVVKKEEMIQIAKRKLSGVQSIFLRHLNRFSSLDANYSKILQENLVFYLDIEEENLKSIKPIRNNNKVLFLSQYKSPSQWMIVEKSVVEGAVRNREIKSFRTLALQIEPSYSILGFVEEKNEKISGKNKAFALAIFFLFVLVIILAILILINNNEKNQHIVVLAIQLQTFGAQRL